MLILDELMEIASERNHKYRVVDHIDKHTNWLDYAKKSCCMNVIMSGFPKWIFDFYSTPDRKLIDSIICIMEEIPYWPA